MILIDVEARRGSFSLAVHIASDAGIVALFGRSGAGKTTVIDVIAGLVHPTRGRIEIDGATLVDTNRNIFVPVRRRRVGLVYQDSLLFPHLSVRQNLMFGHFFTPRAERRIPFNSVVETLGISALLERRPGTLSGGERQRVALARALLASPRLLLMDEPLASLDIERKREIMSLIERLRDEFRIPIIYESHAIEEVGRLADHVVVLEAGRVIAAGSPAQALLLLHRTDVADRFGLVSIIECHVAGFDADFGLTSLHHPAGAIVLAGRVGAQGKRLRVLIRATDVALARTRPADLSIRTVLHGRVAAIQSDSGPSALVEVALEGGGTLAASVTRRAVADLHLACNVPVFALVKAAAIDERPFQAS
ncbi:MAG: molybdenum ABC transporter ATP-binding protein [Beijerinckiaceae bacterium]